MRATASERLAQLLAGLQAPWIVCGDFNQAPDSWSASAGTAVPTLQRPTYPADRPVEAIDYCLLDGITADAEVLNSDASDHLPLVVRTGLG